MMFLVMGASLSGCLGKRTGETGVAPTSPAETPGTSAPGTDINAFESGLTDIDTVLSDSGGADSIELGVNESTFT